MTLSRRAAIGTRPPADWNGRPKITQAARRPRVREAGVLESSKEGKEVYFWINKDRLLDAIETVSEYIRTRA